MSQRLAHDSDLTYDGNVRLSSRTNNARKSKIGLLEIREWVAQ